MFSWDFPENFLSHQVVPWEDTTRGNGSPYLFNSTFSNRPLNVFSFINIYFKSSDSFSKESSSLELKEVLEALEVFDFLLPLWGGVSCVMTWAWGSGLLALNRVWISSCISWALSYNGRIQFSIKCLTNEYNKIPH